MSLIEDIVRSLPLRSPEERAEEAYKRRVKRARLYKNNTREHRKYEMKYREGLQKQMVIAYGGACTHCGENDSIVLLLDHIRDDAQEDRALNGHKGGYHLYAKLKKLGWPKDSHQLLCHNCNYRKEYNRRKGNAVEIEETS